MARYEITAPHEGTEQIADVTFTNGRATADDVDEGALLYFRRHGYAVEQLDDKPTGRTAVRSRPRG
ncbi:hypothetical protein [Streptomyces sp. cg36]|uniref:hypothetical protein n=1 Tax=Streptomyces sp. cg36 TaxID=3238798 RepID=UPI0034E1E0CC